MKFEILLWLFGNERFGQGFRETDPVFYHPSAAWSPLLFQLDSLASVSIATVQASIPQSSLLLRFGATPPVPCPFAFQPQPTFFVAQRNRCNVSSNIHRAQSHLAL